MSETETRRTDFLRRLKYAGIFLAVLIVLFSLRANYQDVFGALGETIQSWAIVIGYNYPFFANLFYTNRATPSFVVNIIRNVPPGTYDYNTLQQVINYFENFNIGQMDYFVGLKECCAQGVCNTPPAFCQMINPPNPVNPLTQIWNIVSTYVLPVAFLVVPFLL